MDREVLRKFKYPWLKKRESILRRYIESDGLLAVTVTRLVDDTGVRDTQGNRVSKTPASGEVYDGRSGFVSKDR